jgi:hypothetical protein
MGLCRAQQANGSSAEASSDGGNCGANERLGAENSSAE